MPRKSIKLKEDIREFVKICKSVLKDNLISIILFGSIAKNKFNKGSDYDFLVILKKYPKNDAVLGGRINYQCLNKISRPVEIVFMEKPALDDITSAFSLEIQANGKVVYGENCLDKSIFKKFNIKPYNFRGKQVGWKLPA